MAEPTERITRYNDPRQQAAMDNINAITSATERHTGPKQGQHVKNWDKVTAASMADLENRMAISPPAQSWAINLHPFPVLVNGGRHVKETLAAAAFDIFEGSGKARKLKVRSLWVQGIGKEETNSEIGCGAVLFPWHEVDMAPQESGSYKAAEIKPIELAQQYVREGNSSELWGKGVLIYEGDMTPEEAYAANAEVSVFDHLGRPIVERVEVKVTPRGSRTPVKQMREQPVKGKFRTLVDQFYEERNASYLRIVKEADAQWQTAEGKEKRWFVTHYTRLMGNLLFKLKIIKKLPPWIMADALDTDAEVPSCMNCGTEKKGKSIKCNGCGNPFPGCVLECYEKSLIEFEHASMQTLDEGELTKAYKIKKDREERHAKAQAKVGIKPKEEKA